jgi:hypothetical protein
VKYNVIHFLILLTGLILLAFSIWEYNQSVDLIQEGIQTTATVVSIVRRASTNSEGSTWSYIPVFEYKIGNNQVRQFEYDVSSSWNPWIVGEKKEVLYTPQEEIVKFISFWGLFRTSVLQLCLALPLLVVGGGYFLFELKYRFSIKELLDEYNNSLRY